MLPTYVSLKENDVDLRYYLIASGNFSLIGRDTLDKDSGFERKVYIDDLEVPIKKRQTVAQLISSIQRYFNSDTANQIDQICRKYESKAMGPALVLGEFQAILGAIKGFKYCWAYALALPYGKGNDIHKQLREVLAEMKFKNEDCVLVRHGKSYRSIYKYLIRRLSDYLLERKHEIDSFPIEKINPMISSIYSNEVGDLIQGKYLQHYISAKSLSVLMQIYFTDKTNYEDMFDECHPRDLITVFIYWAIIKAKCSPTPLGTPAFRGVDWLREVEDTLDLSFIKILTPEEQRAKEVKKAKKEMAVANREDFPTLSEEIGSQVNQKTLFELMHKSNKDQFQSYKKKGKKVAGGPQKTVAAPEPARESHTAGMRGRGGRKGPSRSDAWGVQSDSEDENQKKAEVKKLETEYLMEMKKADGKEEKKKPQRVDKFDDDDDGFPKIDKAIPSKPIISPQRLPLHMTAAANNKKDDDDDDDFPTLGGGAPRGPVFEQISQSAKSGPSKKKPTQQAAKKASQATDAAKSIVNVKPNKNEKESEGDFPTLGGGPVFQQPSPVAPVKKEAPKEKVVQVPLYSTAHFKDAEDFGDDFQPLSTKKEKKKPVKLAAEDFPGLEAKTPAHPVFVSKYEARRNEILDIYEHLSPEEKELYGIGQGRNQLKPPKAKKFDDLEDAADEEPQQVQKKETKAQRPAPTKKDDEEEFPSFGAPPTQNKAAVIIPKDFTKAAAIEGSDIVISKKSKKKK